VGRVVDLNGSLVSWVPCAPGPEGAPRALALDPPGAEPAS